MFVKQAWNVRNNGTSVNMNIVHVIYFTTVGLGGERIIIGLYFCLPYYPWGNGTRVRAKFTFIHARVTYEQSTLVDDHRPYDVHDGTSSESYNHVSVRRVSASIH